MDFVWRLQGSVLRRFHNFKLENFFFVHERAFVHQFTAKPVLSDRNSKLTSTVWQYRLSKLKKIIEVCKLVYGEASKSAKF
jgi:hypothetical protein